MKRKPPVSGPARGESNGRALLTEEDVREIRAWLKGGHSAYAVAKSYGVSATNILLIKHRRTWKHVK